MEIQLLNAREILEISGGNDSDYNLGYTIGNHLRHGIKAFGEFLQGVSSILSPFD